MAQITVSAQMELGKGQYHSMEQHRDVPTISEAISIEAKMKQSFGALRNVNTTISVVLTGETEEQLRTVVASKGLAVYGPFMSERTKVARYLVGRPKGEGSKNTGELV